ncbi:molecular chaperone DnaJ [Frankia sp. R43]|uniref:DnaJ domain-containing protein n=1 Tax=Frankia sp. R43 TaxID=269536 RepID=UPI0006CA4947|nr:DnaJ domain-containing protein [Frankia sp. R43]KPM53836.1 molecular chaperone DnaJ [Frankia sp. R43]
MRDTPKSQSAQYLRASMYEVLGIAPTASDEEVHAAYRRVVKRAHPDAGGSQRAFLRVNAAYRVLSDPGMRRAHDLWLAHLLDAYDEPGRSGGNRSPQGRGTPGGRTGSGGRAGSAAPDPSGRSGRPDATAPGQAQAGGSGAPAPGAGSPDAWAGAAGAAGAGSGPFGASSGPRGADSGPFGSADGTLGGQENLDEPGHRGATSGRRRSRRRAQSADSTVWQSDQPDIWAAWSDDEATAWSPSRRARHRYLISMALCLTLFVLAGAVVRLYSIPVALGMTAAAMIIPPLAVFAVNTSRRR